MPATKCIPLFGTLNGLPTRTLKVEGAVLSCRAMPAGSDRRQPYAEWASAQGGHTTMSSGPLPIRDGDSLFQPFRELDGRWPAHRWTYIAKYLPGTQTLVKSLNAFTKARSAHCSTIPPSPIAKPSCTSLPKQPNERITNFPVITPQTVSRWETTWMDSIQLLSHRQRPPFQRPNPRQSFPIPLRERPDYANRRSLLRRKSPRFLSREIPPVLPSPQRAPLAFSDSADAFYSDESPAAPVKPTFAPPASPKPGRCHSTVRGRICFREVGGDSRRARPDWRCGRGADGERR
jgi:hypothetical protein